MSLADAACLQQHADDFSWERQDVGGEVVEQQPRQNPDFSPGCAFSQQPDCCIGFSFEHPQVQLGPNGNTSIPVASQTQMRVASELDADLNMVYLYAKSTRPNSEVLSAIVQRHFIHIRESDVFPPTGISYTTVNSCSVAHRSQGQWAEENQSG